jgi:hypothetical protein
MGDEKVDIGELSPLGQIALEYAQKYGFKVFPLKPRSKLPATQHGYKDASNDPAVIRAWWRRMPDANIGIATGKASGVIVLDVDAQHGGLETLARLEDENGRLPDAPTVRTGNGGLHIYFRDPGELRNSTGLVGPGIDVRGDGGYVVAAGSIHENGTVYRWEK